MSCNACSLIIEDRLASIFLSYLLAGSAAVSGSNNKQARRSRRIFLTQFYEDLRNDIKFLNKESQDRIIDVCKHLGEKHGYNKNKFSFNDYPTIGFPSNTHYHCTNRKNGFDDQNVIDDEMKEYLQMVLDEMKKKNQNSL